MAAPILALTFGWPNYYSYLALAAALGLYAQMTVGFSLWLASAACAISAGLAASEYRGPWLTTLPLLALACLFLPRGALRLEWFTNYQPEALAIGAIIEARGQLQLVTSLEPVPEGLIMFSEQSIPVPEPLDLDEHCYLLAADQPGRKKFLRQLPRRSLLAKGALLAIGRQGLLALASAAAIFFFAPGLWPLLQDQPLLLAALAATPILLALINVGRIYTHLRQLVSAECKKLHISAQGEFDFSALQQLLNHRQEPGA